MMLQVRCTEKKLDYEGKGIVFTFSSHPYDQENNGYFILHLPLNRQNLYDVGNFYELKLESEEVF